MKAKNATVGAEILLKINKIRNCVSSINNIQSLPRMKIGMSQGRTHTCTYTYTYTKSFLVEHTLL